MKEYPEILLAILARDKESCLDLYLNCIKGLDYPKDKICIYIRTNNNQDNTLGILKLFVEENSQYYANIEFDSTEESDELNDHRHHDWNYLRFKVLGKIRNESIHKTLEHKCDFYFVVDCDNFILPHTLKKLVSYNLPIVSPLLDNDQNTLYANFHYDVDDNGYYKDNPMYSDIFSRTVKGIIEVKVVHCTYLVRADVIDKLTYDDESGRYEYVILSDSARKNNITQYIDNTDAYGMITFKVDIKERQELEDSLSRYYIQTSNNGETNINSENVFTNIYANNIWGGSGMGSTLEYTISYRLKLMEFIKEFKCENVIDIGCGDWKFSSLIDWNGINYLGIDVVQSLIDNHNGKYKDENINFEKMDVLNEYDSLPITDLFILKDVIQHWPTWSINQVLTSLQKKCKYLLITNCSHQSDNNQDIIIGDFRPLSYKMKPLNKFEPTLYHAFHTKEMIYINGNMA